jgi:hypothetical protein
MMRGRGRQLVLRCGGVVPRGAGAVEAGELLHDGHEVARAGADHLGRVRVDDHGLLPRRRRRRDLVLMYVVGIPVDLVRGVARRPTGLPRRCGAHLMGS